MCTPTLNHYFEPKIMRIIIEIIRYLLQKDFFQLKELEKLCQKEKGITSMSVKEILQGLVDDGMVDTDKIGTSVYFWAFPSKAGQNVIPSFCICLFTFIPFQTNRHVRTTYVTSTVD